MNFLFRKGGTMQELTLHDLMNKIEFAEKPIYIVLDEFSYYQDPNMGNFLDSFRSFIYFDPKKAHELSLKDAIEMSVLRKEEWIIELHVNHPDFYEEKLSPEMKTWLDEKDTTGIISSLLEKKKLHQRLTGLPQHEQQEQPKI